MNPKQKEVHMTTDGMGFFDAHKAEDHQRRLGKGKKIETFAFEDSEYGKQVAAKIPLAPEPQIALSGDGSGVALPALKDLSFEELKAAAGEKGIDIAGLKSKKSLIEVIGSNAAENLEVTDPEMLGAE